MKTFLKVLTYFLLPVAILALAYLTFDSIRQPVKFQKDVQFRKGVAVERLKDIRTLQDTYKTENGRFVSTIDSLIDFYKNGTMVVVKQIGSLDDSLAVAQKRVRRDSIRIAVKDSLFNNIPNYIVDSIKYIPFSGGKEIQMESVIKVVSGVNVPLFEASIPFDDLLNGLDKQLIINLKAEQKDLGRYEGYKVGSITNPNNNAGNWE